MCLPFYFKCLYIYVCAFECMYVSISILYSYATYTSKSNPFPFFNLTDTPEMKNQERRTFENLSNAVNNMKMMAVASRGGGGVSSVF